MLADTMDAAYVEGQFSIYLHVHVHMLISWTNLFILAILTYHFFFVRQWIFF